MKKNSIRLLIVEDFEDDALLLIEELRRGGYDPTFVRVETESEYQKELLKNGWDIIISDFNLPRFNGLRALEILKNHHLEVPFILVSGTVGEDVAVQAMKAGAQDYIMKTNYVRLAPAIAREISDNERRKKDKEALKQKGEELIQAQKMEAIGQLAGGLAHDFNNILGVIGLLAETIDRSPHDEKNVKVTAGKISQAQEKANQIVRQLLMVGRKVDSRPIILDLNQAIRNLEFMLQLALGKQHELRLNLDPHPLHVMFDPGQLEQVLLNLAVNARDALEDDGILTIQTLMKDSGQVHLKVSDNGCGMDEKVRLRIFEPFFTTKPIGEGTGLGLSTTFGIVHHHNGKIYVESEKGKGTTFHIILNSSHVEQEAKS